MHNQHTDLSQTLADQHRTELQEQATHQRLPGRPPTAPPPPQHGRPVAGGSWPAGQPSPRTS